MSNWDSPGRNNQTGHEEPIWEHYLPADPQAVPDARRAAIHACHESGASEEDCFTLDIALGEALANAVVHGAPATPDPRPRPRSACGCGTTRGR